MPHSAARASRAVTVVPSAAGGEPDAVQGGIKGDGTDARPRHARAAAAPSTRRALIGLVPPARVGLCHPGGGITPGRYGSAMAAYTSGPNGLVPVHIAVHDPAQMEEPGPQAADYARKLFAASAKYAGISWTRHGADPRWLGMDTSTCAAAINPSHVSGHGADEFDRFLSEAASRGEPALIIATMGTADDDDDRVWSVFGRPGGRVDFRHFTGAIVGKRLPAGTEVSLVPGLDAADHDFGLRLRNRPASAPWWAMTLQAGALQGPRGTTVREPEGELVPILVDSLGGPVVARWTSGDAQQIWYVIPDRVDWNQVVDWLVQRALRS